MWKWAGWPCSSGENGWMPPGGATGTCPRWGGGGPAFTALCARPLVPSSDAWLPLEIQEVRRETAETGQKALPWENEKRIKSPLVESGERWCPTVQLAALSPHICAQSGSAHPAEPPLSPPRLCSPLLEPDLFSTLHLHTLFSPLQLYRLPSRCSVAKFTQHLHHLF